MADIGISNPAPTTAQGSSVLDLLAKYLGIPVSQLGTSSGQGPYGNWSASITPEQYQALIAAGYDPNAATTGTMGMQQISLPGDPTMGGVSVSPTYSPVLDEGAISLTARGPLTG